jgi:hypothetical protein
MTDATLSGGGFDSPDPGDGPDGGDALREALDRAAKLQRRLDAVQALLAEERAETAEQAAGNRSGYEEAAALRDDLAHVRGQLVAVQRELRQVRASSTWRTGLAVRRAARPAVAARRRALRAARRVRSGLRGRGRG